jgi:hypothetical protein
MSYEGYSQFLCKNGHAWEENCNFVDSKNKCPTCGEKFIWENMVDVTNGSYYEGERIDGYIELKVKSIKSCSHCGKPQEVTYKIPKTKKRK